MKYTLPLLTFLLTATTVLFSLDPLEPGPIKLHYHKRDNGLDKTVSQEPKKHVTFAQQVDNINAPKPEAKPPTIIEPSTPEKTQPAPIIIVTPPINNSNDIPHDNSANLSLEKTEAQEKKLESKIPKEIAPRKPKKSSHSPEKQQQLSTKNTDTAKENDIQDNKLPSPVSVLEAPSIGKRFIHTLAATLALCGPWDYIFSKTGTANWAATPVYTFTADSKCAALNTISRAHIIYGLTAGAILLGVYKIIFSYCSPEAEEELF